MESRILIVDDEKDIRDVLSLHLSCLQVQIDHAQDGQEAFEMITRQSYDLVLSDLMMPKMSGRELLISLGRCGISVPVLMVSAFGTESLVLECLRLGALNFISKPWNRAELVAHVELYLKDAKLSRLKTKIG